MVSDKPKREAKPVAKYMPEEPKATTKTKKKATKASGAATAAKKPGAKKPLTGFMLFANNNREAAKKKLPSGLEKKDVMKTVSKILGEMWQKESEANKAMWKAGKVPK